jgi:hypothetical protein
MITFGHAMIQFEPGQGDSPAKIVESKSGFMEQVHSHIEIDYVFLW